MHHIRNIHQWIVWNWTLDSLAAPTTFEIYYLLIHEIYVCFDLEATLTNVYLLDKVFYFYQENDIVNQISNKLTMKPV